MLLKISHSSIYTVDHEVDYALQQARLAPNNLQNQSVIKWKLCFEGAKQELAYQDEYMNNVTLISIDQGATNFSVKCEGEVETKNNAGIFGAHSGYVPLWFFQRSTELTKAGANVRGLLSSLDKRFNNEIDKFHALSKLISSKVAYEIGQTDATTNAEAALEARSGVCQDHAHIFIACARSLGYPARYVSGYLMMNDRIEQEATHAWAEVHLENIGWVGFDVSNGISPDERYIRIASGLDFKDASPVSGIRIGAGEESVVVSIQVQQ